MIRSTLQKAIANILSSHEQNFDTFIKHAEKPVILMFVGVNGTGKTTTIAKVAHRLQQQGLTCVMGACDTFRAGAIEQLTLHADRLGIKIIKHGTGTDPAAVAFDTVKHAKARHKDVVLLDTAGRMQTNVNLMDEMRKLKRVAEPNMIIFVGDALTGNDAVEQAKRFNEVVGIDGVILNKVDADAKGGAALSIAYTIGKPLLFIGNGQEYSNQIAFTPDWMIERLFGVKSSD
jgi:fused signal recognition particle receptor